MTARCAGLTLLVGLTACDVVPVRGTDVEAVRGAATLDQVTGTMAADVGRTGLYANQPALDPVTVGSPYFGQLFDAALEGAIYAQPLTAAGVVFVATETNHLYGLDPATGAPLWSRQLGNPWLAADFNCGDLQPAIGVSGTPAVDAATGTAYLLSKTYVSGSSGVASWHAHAIELATGAERDGFPVEIAGAASNEPSQIFDPTNQMQRPGLLLMNGVVYAGFGAHCDVRPFVGWIVGISTKGYVSTLWTTEGGPGNPNGGGIWQSGGGLVSDGDGQILFATGNDWTNLPGPVPGHAPPVALGESIVRLSVQPDGTLAATDFFAPAERATLNQEDADLGSGAPVALPDAFGTATHPHLLAHAGKSGYLYLLDRDDLGGFAQGADGGDRVMQRLGPYGGVWSKPSVWTGDGGFVYVPVVNGCADADDPAGCLRAYRVGASADGTPMLSAVATSSSSFAYGASAVVVTSDGTRAGSALLWTVWSSGWTGAGSELRAYDAVPQGGTLALRYLAGIGTSAKFTAPALGDGRLYVGTRDGHVLGFGVTGAPSLRAQGAAFAPTVVGDVRTSSVEVTAVGASTVVGLGISGDFALADGAPAVPFVAVAGTTFELPVAFRPSTDGPIVGTLRITTDAGSFAIPLTGVGQSRTPELEMSPSVLTFAPIVMGSVSIQTVTITNMSDAAMTLTGVTPPAPPFSVSGLPVAGTVLEAGDALIATITYAPTMPGSSSGYLGLVAGDSIAAVAIEGGALLGGKLRLAPDGIEAGSMTVGDVVTATFQLTNDGDVPVTLEKSKPPTSAAFQALSPLDEGTILAPGESREVLVRVSPTVVGLNTGTWQLNANDGQGLRVLPMNVTGVAAPVVASGAATASDPSTASSSASLTSGPSSRSSSGSNDTVVGGCSFGGASSTASQLAAALVALALASRRRRR